MFNAIIERCNSFAQTWAWWLGMSILDAAIVLTVVSLLWYAIRRKAPPQLGYLLFLLVPLKLFVPLYIAIPERMFSWAPLTAARGIGQDTAPTAPPSAVPSMVNSIDMPIRPDSRVAQEDRFAGPTKSFAMPASFSVENRPTLSLFAWLMIAWFLGILTLLMRLAHAQIRFHRTILRNARVVDPSRFSVDISGLCKRLGLGWSIRIVESDCISSPVVWGVFRPTLILPAGFATSLLHKQLEWVLLHELAHVRRRDLAVNCFQRAAGILHFLNPSIWIANRTIDRFREYACDDMASAYGGISQVESGEAFLGVMRYAAAVQRRPETNLEGALGMFESTVRASCFKRMTRLLDTNRRLSVKLRWGSLCLLLLTAALALPQIRAANPQAVDEKTTEKKEEQSSKNDVQATADKKQGGEKEEKKKAKSEDSVYKFNVVVARHVLLLEGKDIVTWPEIEAIIAKRPNPPQTQPHFYITRGAHEAGLYEPTKKEIWRLHNDYKLVGYGEGSLWPRSDLRYDRIQSSADLKPDESLRIEGNVVNQKGEPVADAEIIMIPAIGDSISDKIYHMTLVEGCVYNPLDHLMTRSNDQGIFTLYPPISEDFYILAFHPDGGIAYSGRDMLVRDHKITLLAWAGLVSEFSKEPEKQFAMLSTSIKPSGNKPEINISQEINGLGKEPSSMLFHFKHVPPIFETTIQRNFPGKEGTSFSLPGASLGLIPGETRRLDLGPLTEQQRKWLEQIQHDSQQRQEKLNSKNSDFNPDSKKANSSVTAQAAVANGRAAVAKNGGQQFELKIQGQEGKPAPEAEVELRGDSLPTSEQIGQGKFIRKSTYGVIVQADADGRLVLNLAKKPIRFNVHIEIPGYGPYWTEWNSEEHPEPIPAKFTAELDAGWSVGGVLVDEQGKPIEGAIIHPSIQFKNRPGDVNELHVGTELTTDAEGKWQFDSVPVSMQDVFVEITHPDFKPNRRSLSQSEFGIRQGDKPTAIIEMQRGLTVSGKVTDEAGKPIVSALIRTKFMNNIREAKTNQNGEYRLVGCEPTMTKIVVSAKDRATDMKEIRVDSDMEPVNFAMKPGGKIRIRVVDEKNNPVPNARIMFQWWRGPFKYFEFDFISQYADANGAWQWNEAPLDEIKADICRPDGMQLLKQPLVARDEEYVFRTYSPLVVSGDVVDAESKRPIKSFHVVPGARWPDKQIFWERDDGYLATDGQYHLQRSRGEIAHLLRIEADGYKAVVSREIKSDEGAVRLDFELTKAKDIAAIVLTPDGKPAVGAKIALGIAGSQIMIDNGMINDRSTYAAKQETDNAGQFHFPSPGAVYQLVITHSAGFARLKSSEQEISSSITLTPWARAEGTFRVGEKFAANVPLTINSDSINSHEKDGLNIFTEHHATTDAEGRFVFERVFPGNGRIGRFILLMVNDGAKDVASTSMIPAKFTAGETTRLDLGGTGRPVIGKLAPPAGYNEKVLWNFAMIGVDIPSPKPPQVPVEIRNDQKKVDAYMASWSKSDEAKAWQKTSDAHQKARDASPYIWASVDRDGSFRIDDVPAGEYMLSVRFSEHSAGYLLYRFSVPPGDAKQVGEPLDLGRLTLEKPIANR